MYVVCVDLCANLLRAAAVVRLHMHVQQDFRTLQSMPTEHLPLLSHPNIPTLLTSQLRVSNRMSCTFSCLGWPALSRLVPMQPTSPQTHPGFQFPETAGYLLSSSTARELLLQLVAAAIVCTHGGSQKQSNHSTQASRKNKYERRPEHTKPLGC